MVPKPQPSHVSGGSLHLSEKKTKASDRVSKVGGAALPKNEPSNKTFKARVISSFSSFFKTIRDIFKHLFCCGCFDKDKSLSESDASESISVTSSDSDTSSEPIKKPVPATKPDQKPIIASKVDDPALILAKMISERAQAEKDLEGFALELEKHRTDFPQEPNLLPRPQKNLGQTCYMNAALQCLDGSHGLKHPYCNQLVQESLVRPDDKSLLDFEEEVLSKWSPVEHDKESLLDLQKKLISKLGKLNDEDKEKFIRLQGLLKNVEKKIQDEVNLENNQNLLADKLIQLDTATTDKEKAALNKQILDLNFSVLEKQDKILFKWSYLLLLQAKRYGTDNQVIKALQYHHNICFTIARGDLKDEKRHYGDKITNLRSTRKRAQDAASYFDLWHDMMSKQLDASRYKEFTHEGKQFIHHINVDPISVVLLHTTGKNDDFMSCVRNYFDAAEHMDPGLESNANGIPVTVNDYIDHRRLNQLPPKFLTFSLKKIDLQQNKRVLVKDSIPFSRDKNKKPIGNYQDILVLDEYFENKKAHYRLVGCTVHTGTDGNGGHYIAYVLGNDKQWYECSDEKVVPFKFDDDDLFKNARTFTYGKLK